MSLAIGKDQVGLVPFLRAAYETEFTPIELGTAAGGDLILLPRRSFLSGTAGAGLFPGGFVQEWKLGAIVRKDFAKQDTLVLAACGGMEGDEQELVEHEAAVDGVTENGKCRIPNGDLCPGGANSSCPSGSTTTTINGSTCTVTRNGLVIFTGVTVYDTRTR